MASMVLVLSDTHCYSQVATVIGKQEWASRIGSSVLEGTCARRMQVGFSCVSLLPSEHIGFLGAV